ncbi:hypothetical protein [Micromonospora sp. NBC_01796]|uniref:hypothetical protein n=1 Tax=Micromonospora sp. NBC_01796 TaxID=2975987 RepID=UPI002DDA87EA|nr:hypothetical protein [Micromonospora sp. NBC_01796]WSA85031.1 hypothetical protein OIE47_32505 [Micromonospora sp. NBC_01796]
MRIVRVGPRPAPAVTASLVLVAVLAGCGSGGAGVSPYPTPTAPVVVPANCPAPVNGSALPGLTFEPGPAGNVPADFVAVAALRCTVVTPEPAGPTVVREERVDGPGLDGLLTALATPWATQRADVCLLALRVSPYVALVAADGTAIRPALPLDGCGQPQVGVVEAISGLPWRTVREKQR